MMGRSPWQQWWRQPKLSQQRIVYKVAGHPVANGRERLTTTTHLHDADQRLLVDDGRVEVPLGDALHDPLDPLFGLGVLERFQETLEVPRRLHAQPDQRFQTSFYIAGLLLFHFLSSLMPAHQAQTIFVPLPKLGWLSS